MSKATRLKVEGVDLFYGTNHVLKGIDLEVRPGELFAFLGPSGCGKTTLLRLIAGFAFAQRGRVLVGDDDISALPPWKRDIGLVFQSYALWPHMSVRRNVAFGLEERRVSRAETGRRVEAALSLVGLTDLADRRPSQLSGGQQQRVALARTLVVEPRLLLLDEPLSNLDAKLRIRVRRELRDLQRRLGLTTIFVTHDQEEANTICDRVAVMHDGVVQQVGTPLELYERPANLFVAGFLGAANILAGRVREAGGDRVFELEGGGAGIVVPEGVAVPPGARLVFRPQDAVLATQATDHEGLAGRIVQCEFLGSVLRYGIRIGAANIDVDVPFQAGRVPLPAGTDVTVAVPPRAALWLSP